MDKQSGESDRLFKKTQDTSAEDAGWLERQYRGKMQYHPLADAFVIRKFASRRGRSFCRSLQNIPGDEQLQFSFNDQRTFTARLGIFYHQKANRGTGRRLPENVRLCFRCQT